MIRRDQHSHGTPPDFDGTKCPKCASRATVEVEPPMKPHGTYWAAFMLCPLCGHEWRAIANTPPYDGRTDPEPDGSAGRYDS